MSRSLPLLSLAVATTMLSGCVVTAAAVRDVIKTLPEGGPTATGPIPPGSVYCYREETGSRCLPRPDDAAAARLFWYVGPTPASSLAWPEAPDTPRAGGKLYPMGDGWTTGEPGAGVSTPLTEPKPTAAPRMAVQRELLPKPDAPAIAAPPPVKPPTTPRPAKEPAPHAAPRQKVQSEDLPAAPQPPETLQE
ncbi:MAG: hypothetical protein H7840_14055 [Alphaproteobacteria bacterium]